jgi:multidrug resistance efflux pump
MITIILALYVIGVVITFKVIKLAVNPKSVTAAALVGVVLLSSVVIAWNMGSPISDQMIVKRNVIPLVVDEESKGLISKIHVKGHELLKKGDPLWEVDSAPNQFAVDSLAAQVGASEAQAKQAEASVQVAVAMVEQARAEQQLAMAQLETAMKAQELNSGAVAELTVEVKKQDNLAAEAAVNQALASQNEAGFALTTAKNAVAALREQLDTAKLNLRQNVVRAPADGYVMNMQVTEGSMTTTLVTSGQGAFMDMSRTFVIVVYPQNMLKHVASGDEVEIAFKSLPGQLATGTVDAILEYTGEGQLAPGTTVPQVASIGAKGFLVVRVILDDEELARDLPLGGAGTAAIYTGALGPFHLISKVTIRMKMWMNYLPF